MKILTKKTLLFVLGVLLVANFGVWQVVFVNNSKNEKKELTVAFLDIGQGDAIYIEAPNGNQVIVDAGPNAKILHELGALMPWYDKSIDMIIVTNPDKDHIAGFVDVLKRYKVSYLIESGTENKTLTNQAVQDLVDQKKVEKIKARRGMEIILDDGVEDGTNKKVDKEVMGEVNTKKGEVKLTILFPDKDVSKEKSNDGSIMMRLTYGETEVMLTGDAPSSVEKHLLSLHDLSIESDILKVGHHGSKTSTSLEFVKAVKPQFAVISSGKENKYGHPTEEVLDRLNNFESPIKILRTDQRGTIVMKSDGKVFKDTLQK